MKGINDIKKINKGLEPTTTIGSHPQWFSQTKHHINKRVDKTQNTFKKVMNIQVPNKILKKTNMKKNLRHNKRPWIQVGTCKCSYCLYTCGVPHGVQP